jgi:hypothetical protein
MRWAKALGATVIGVVGSVDKLDSAKAGSTLALHSKDPQFLERVRDIAPNGVDVIYDFVGAATFGQSIAAVRDCGTIGAPPARPSPIRTCWPAAAYGSQREVRPYVTSATVDRASEELFEGFVQGSSRTSSSRIIRSARPREYMRTLPRGVSLGCRFLFHSDGGSGEGDRRCVEEMP